MHAWLVVWPGCIPRVCCTLLPARHPLRVSEAVLLAAWRQGCPDPCHRSNVAQTPPSRPPLICQVFEKKRVLVVGCGETGLDLTYRAVIAPAKEVSLLARRGFLSVPTEGAGKGVPLDTMIPNLFESSYVHPWLEWCDRPASPHPLRAHARSFVVPQLPARVLLWCRNSLWPLAGTVGFTRPIGGHRSTTRDRLTEDLWCWRWGRAGREDEVFLP